MVKYPQDFNRPRWRGLKINPASIGAESLEGIEGLFRTPRGPALRHPDKRENKVYLRSEAEIIMNTILPGEESLYDFERRSQLKFKLVVAELNCAFRNLDLL